MSEETEKTHVDYLIEYAKRINETDFPDWLKRDLFHAAAQGHIHVAIRWAEWVPPHEQPSRSH